MLLSSSPGTISPHYVLTIQFANLRHYNLSSKTGYSNVNHKKEGLHLVCSCFYFTLFNSNPTDFPSQTNPLHGFKEGLFAAYPGCLQLFSSFLNHSVPRGKSLSVVVFCKTVFQNSYTKHSLLANKQFLKILLCRIILNIIICSIYSKKVLRSWKKSTHISKTHSLTETELFSNRTKRDCFSSRMDYKDVAVGFVAFRIC